MTPRREDQHLISPHLVEVVPPVALLLSDVVVLRIRGWIGRVVVVHTAQIVVPDRSPVAKCQRYVLDWVAAHVPPHMDHAPPAGRGRCVGRCGMPHAFSEVRGMVDGGK